ncbi:MAG: DUF4437 domain-containing protein [Planctomycetota bacterium]|nr:DUF4437 domain-containing protein [Planctomycetota bacterium]
MSKHTLFLGISFVVVAGVWAVVASMHEKPDAPPSTVRVLKAAEVEWQMLNPLRGDKSPRAGTLWGDRGKPVPCGFLVKFVDGFSSPPHIHPVTYRGVVVSGEVHNDVPEAETVWLPPGTFWTQPAGEVHITSAQGSENVAYIEIERGPYLVHPAKEAFERPYAPVKMTPASMSWTDPAGASSSEGGPKVCTLPGNPDDDQLRRALVKLPGGFKGTVESDGADLHVVVIEGTPEHHVRDKTEAEALPAGSYFGSTGKVAHRVTCASGGTCLLYVRTDGTFEVKAQP